MAGKAYWSDPISLLVRGLLLGLLVPILLAFGAAHRNKYGTPQGAAKFDPFKYLPSGAKIKNREKDVVFADLDGDGHEEVIIFYTLGDDPNNHKANIMVLNRNGADYVYLWEDSYDGSWGFAEPTGVYDLSKSGTPQIVAYRTVGASCPGALEIYDYRSGRIRRLTGTWGYKGHCEAVKIKDLDGDGVSEIIIARTHGRNDDIYRWNGKTYVHSNSQFPEYYNSELEKLVQAIYSRDAFPTSARVTWASQIVKIYLIQRRYFEATHLCRAALRMIDDPGLTKPNAIIKGTEAPEALNKIRAYFEVEKIRGKGTIYRLLGDIYKAVGNINQSQSYYNKGQALEIEAKEKDSTLPR